MGSVVFVLRSDNVEPMCECVCVSVQKQTTEAQYLITPW